MYYNGVINSVFIMSLTKQQLIDAHEQGSIINTRNGNIKIVAILGDVYGVNHCDTNSKLVKLWMFENFERNQATIEQHKPKIDLSILKEGEIYFAKSTMYNYLFKLRYSTQSEIIWDSNVLLRDNEINNLSAGIKLSYVSELRLPTESELELFYSKFPDLKPKKYNGRAVKCDTVEQLQWLNSELKEKSFNTQFLMSNHCICISDKNSHSIGKIQNEQHFKHECYEIIPFSQYCSENGIVEPKWIQGFEVKDGYKDAVMMSNNGVDWQLNILIEVDNTNMPFVDSGDFCYKYCRYPRKEEINEIKFSN